VKSLPGCLRRTHHSPHLSLHAGALAALLRQGRARQVELVDLTPSSWVTEVPARSRTPDSSERMPSHDLVALVPEPRQQLLHRQVRHDPAGAHDRHPVAELLGDLQPVGGEHDRLALVMGQLSDSVLDRAPSFHVEAMVGSSSTGIRGSVITAAARAAFCCLPREKPPTCPGGPTTGRGRVAAARRPPYLGTLRVPSGVRSRRGSATALRAERAVLGDHLDVRAFREGRHEHSAPAIRRACSGLNRSRKVKTERRDLAISKVIDYRIGHMMSVLADEIRFSCGVSFAPKQAPQLGLT
jgi:hypothetical protein